MIKVIFSIAMILFVNSIFGQNISVDYKFSIVDNKDQYGITGFSIVRVISNQSESIIYSKNIDTIIKTTDNAEPHVQQATSFTATSFKQFIVGKRYTRTLFPKYNLKDENYSIEWQLTNESKTIIGYKCFKAIGNYRGRDYIAYFTTEIPIQSGPNTFDNLPGHVLEVFSTDGIVKFKAFQVKETNEKIYNVFDEDKREYISWEDFVNTYKSYFNKMINYKPEEDISFIVPNRGIEIYFNN